MTNKIELLSPVGSPEALRAAVMCGADAVYLGAPIFNARQSAQNFGPQQLKEGVEFSHRRGVSVFITLNTLISDKETPEFLETLKTANEIGVDAVIVQDLGMAMLIKTAIPKMRIHASTQMSIHNLDGVMAAYKMGASRVVLARELDYKNIEYICKNSPIEIEVFVHGALCMSHSGQCLMSALIAQRSGNRGRCGQPCRLLYSHEGDRPAALLSLKDLSLAEHIQKLKEAGVASLKIEGRLKRPEYVALSTWMYRKLITTGRPPSQNDMKRLELMFSRNGFTDGYFTGNIGKNMFGTREELKDTAEFERLCKQTRALYTDAPERQNIDISFNFNAHKGVPAILEAKDPDNNTVSVKGYVPEAAITKPLETKVVKEQLEKTGPTQYYVKSMEIEIENGISMPLSAINAMRREAVLKLDQIRGEPRVREFSMPILYDRAKNFSRHPGFCVSVDKIEQLDHNILKSKLDYIYFPLEIIEKEKQNIKSLISEGQNMCIKLPRVYFDTQKQDIIDMIKQAGEIGIKTALCTNISQIDLLKFHGFNIRGDFSLNVFNSYSVKVLSKMGLSGVTLSYELMLPQVRDIRKNIESELVVYGRLELMLCENCIVKDSYKGCNKCKTPQFIKDRMGQKFLLRGEYGCRNTILNSQPLYLLDKLYDYDKLGLTHLRLNFTDETKEECGRLFLNAINCAPGKPQVYTRGLYYKGVR